VLSLHELRQHERLFLEEPLQTRFVAIYQERIISRWPLGRAHLGAGEGSRTETGVRPVLSVIRKLNLECFPVDNHYPFGLPLQLPSLFDIFHTCFPLQQNHERRSTYPCRKFS